MTPFALDHPAVTAYLGRLDAATAHLPADERIEIAEGIRSHLIAALGEAHTEADVRSTLDALGDPEEIVGSPPPQPAPAPASPAFRPTVETPRSARGALEIGAVIFLLVGAIIVPFVGWFVGVVMLWVSKAWTTREKLLGTFVAPGGLAVAPLLGAFVFAFAGPSCVGSTGTVVEISPNGASGPVTGTPVEVCSAGGVPEWAAIAVLVFFVVGPIFSAIYLLRAAGRRPAV